MIKNSQRVYTLPLICVLLLILTVRCHVNIMPVTSVVNKVRNQCLK